MNRLLGLCMALCLLTTVAHGDGLEEARAHFNTAQQLYAQGKFLDAAIKFDAAYKAKAYPQFLFNIGAAYEKAKKYEKAVTFYERYLGAVPNAKDKDTITKRIEVLKEELARIKRTGSRKESQAVKALTDVKLQGVVRIQSSPAGATIWLDSKKTEPLGLTPWEGSIEGRHLIFVELEGHSPVQDVIEPTKSNRIRDVRFVLTKQTKSAENYLGLLKVTSNIPAASVYLDKKETGAYGQTPFQKQLDEGKHKIWVGAPGYKTFYKEVEIKKTVVTEIHAVLEGSPVGNLNFRGQGIEQAQILLDGKVVCEVGPCRRAVKNGTHLIEVKRSGFKTYKHQMNVQAQTESHIIVDLAETPSRADAIGMGIASVVVLGGSLYMHLGVVPGLKDDLTGLEADRAGAQQVLLTCEMNNPGNETAACQMERTVRDEFDTEIDSKQLQKSIFTYGSYAGYGIAALTGGIAIYFAFRDKGDPSVGKIDTRAITVKPVVGFNYGGFQLGGRF